MTLDIPLNYPYTPETVIQARNISRDQTKDMIDEGLSSLGKHSSTKSIRLVVPNSINNIIKEQLINRITELDKLNDNWDSYGAIKPNKKTVSQIKAFILGLDWRVLQFLNDEDIYPTPYGTIVMDFYKGLNQLSIEFGESKVGFFTEFINCQNIDSDGVIFDRTVLPNELSKAFTIFLQV